MKYQQLKVTPLRPDLNLNFAQFVSDPAHNIAWTTDVSHLVSLTPTGTHSLPQGVSLQTANLPGKEDNTVAWGGTSKKHRKIADRSLALAGATNALVKYGLPQFNGTAADGVECFVASSQAILALTDPQRTSVVPATFKGARAIVSALELLKTYLPPVISTNLPVVSLLVKVGDAAFQIYLAAREHDDSTQRAAGAQETISH